MGQQSECSRDQGRKDLVNSGGGVGVGGECSGFSLCLAGAAVDIYRENSGGESGWEHKETETGSR